jgi:RNA recognition motif-containing protein
MAEKIFFFDVEGDTRKVTQHLTSVEDLLPLFKEKYSDEQIDATNVKFWTKDKTYQIRHKIETLNDIYDGAVLEVTTGSDNKRKLQGSKQGIAPKRPRVTGPRFVLRLRGLPWRTSQKEIKEFFEGIDLVRIRIVQMLDGRATGDALVEFKNEQDMELGLEKDKENIGDRYIEVFKTTGEDMDRALGIRDNEIKSTQNKVLRMRGLPFSASEKDVIEFFKQGDLIPAKIHILSEPGTGRASGTAFAEFEREQDIIAAMDLNRNEIGNRYIELYKTSMEDLKGALGLHAKQPGFQPGIISGQSRGGGGLGDCIRMRGLPFRTTEMDIANFFLEVDANPLKIHLKEDGSEAYVEFDSADVGKAITKHKSYIGHRYVELYRVPYNEVADIVGLPRRNAYRPFF